MTHDELIAKAREFAEPFERMGEFPVRIAEFPEVRIQETVVVSFSRSEREDRIEVCLDPETGEFVSATYTPPKSRQ